MKKLALLVTAFAVVGAFTMQPVAAEARGRSVQKARWQARVCNNIERSEIRTWKRFDQDKSYRVKQTQRRINLQDRFNCAPTGNIVGQLVERTQFGTLAAALGAADEEISPGELNLINAASTLELTVFAPTEKAFENALAELGFTAEQLLASPLLYDILTYHVVPETVKAADLFDGKEITTLQGEILTVSIDGKKVTLTDQEMRVSTVLITDLEANNGVVHVIDEVVLPNILP